MGKGGMVGGGTTPLKTKILANNPLTTLDPGPRGVVKFWPPKAAENFF